MTDGAIDLNAASGALLAIAGGLLQFLLRQFKRVGDGWYHVVAVLLTVGCFWLVVRDWPRADARDSAIVLVLWISGHLSAVYGGTMVASQGAYRLAESVSSDDNVFIPVTDSK